MLLFITADDFGYCPQRNIGIIDCFGSRGITDASLMVNATYAKEAADLGLKHGLPMGLHFNLSEGRPLNPPDSIKTLVDGEGCFLGKKGTMEAAVNKLLSIAEIEIELIAQIEKFKELTGNYPRRVDGHQHVHIFPTIRDVFGKVLQAYSIKLTRISNDTSLSLADWMSPEVKSFLQIVAKHSIEAKPLFASHHISSTAAFVGSSLMNFESKSNMTLEHLDTVLSALPSDTESVELMVHPGYPNIDTKGGCGIAPDSFSKDISRQWELEFLMNPELQKYLVDKKITVQSWEAAA